MDRLGCALAVLLALAAPGCGSIPYVQVSRAASADVEAARAAGAETRAPYWFTLAVEYLAKAREEAGQADFQVAHRLARAASDAARRALAIARPAGRERPPPAPSPAVSSPPAPSPLAPLAPPAPS